MVDVPRVLQLYGTCNSYPWGRQGRHSLAARLCEKATAGFEIKDDQRYSELWFGDYPDFPGRLVHTKEELATVLDRHRDKLLGAREHLPFLPKIHPDKELAAQLHDEAPDKYPDSNHKPEIAIALSRFEVFAGWKPLDAMSELFSLPFLRHFAPEPQAWTSDTVRQVVRNILQAPADVVAAVETSLMGASKDSQHDYMLTLLPRLKEQYGSDRANLIALLCMNYLVLEPGQALYIPADGLHAYLSGDIVECMARSNNVLQAGFAPSSDRDDVDLFTRALSFGPYTQVGNLRLSREEYSGGSGSTYIYRPPLSEFDMLCLDLGNDEIERLSGHDGPAIAIVTRGLGTLASLGQDSVSVEEGYIFYIAPGTPTVWHAEEPLQVYAAVVAE